MVKRGGGGEKWRMFGRCCGLLECGGRGGGDSGEGVKRIPHMQGQGGEREVGKGRDSHCGASRTAQKTESTERERGIEEGVLSAFRCLRHRAVNI